MAAHLARIRKVNPTINAIVAKLDDDACLALADAADRARRQGRDARPAARAADRVQGPAAGGRLPASRAARRSTRTSGRPRIRCWSSGCAAPARSPSARPTRRSSGWGRTPTTSVYGVTRNPYDPTKSAGGSSGGAGAALASGMLPIADGSDMGGSLRNPGNFNNVVGMRPTVGLVPSAPNPYPLFGFSTNGPLARTVADVALLHERDGRRRSARPGLACRPIPPASAAASRRDVRGKRIAWCPDLGGLPLDPRVRAVLAAQRQTFEALGCVVEDAVPDLRDADCDLPDHARVPQRPGLRPAARRASRPDEAGSDRRDRGGAGADDRRDRQGDAAARPAARADAPLRGALRLHLLRGEPGAAVRRRRSTGRSRSTAWRWTTTSPG